MDDQDYYADLGLTQYATSAQIKSAFHTLAKQHHPDKSGSTDSSAFRRAREAYEKLSDITYRTEYDQNYRRTRMHFEETDDGLTGTRTAAFEAEEALRKAHEAERHRRSPPPYKPIRKPNEPSSSYYLGKAYVAWEKREAAYCARHPEYKSGR